MKWKRVIAVVGVGAGILLLCCWILPWQHWTTVPKSRPSVFPHRRRSYDIVKFRAVLEQLNSAGQRTINKSPILSVAPSQVMTSDKMLEGEMEGQLFLLRDKVSLSEEQRRKVLDLFSLYQAIRAEFESEIASVQYLGTNKMEIDIPPYPEAGRFLKERFDAEMVEVVGQAAYDSINQNIGDDLYARFKAFGNTRQLITAEAVESQGGEVTYRIRWNAMATADVAPNRSNPESKFASNSYAYFLSQSQLQDGEWYGFGRYIMKLKPGG